MNRRYIARQVDREEWEVYDTQKDEQVKWYRRRDRKRQATEHALSLNEIHNRLLWQSREKSFGNIVQLMHDRAVCCPTKLQISAEYVDGRGVVFFAVMTINNTDYPDYYEAFCNAEDALLEILKDYAKD